MTDRAPEGHAALWKLRFVGPQRIVGNKDRPGWNWTVTKHFVAFRTTQHPMRHTCFHEGGGGHRPGILPCQQSEILRAGQERRRQGMDWPPRLKLRTAATKSFNVSAKLLNATGAGKATVASDFSKSLKLRFGFGTAGTSDHSMLCQSAQSRGRHIFPRSGFIWTPGPPCRSSLDP
jgi:hypothetical protein